MLLVVLLLTRKDGSLSFNPCSHVMSAFALCIKRQEWGLWQEVYVLTLIICIAGLQKSKKNANANVTCECTLILQELQCDTFDHARC